MVWWVGGYTLRLLQLVNDDVAARMLEFLVERRLKGIGWVDQGGGDGNIYIYQLIFCGLVFAEYVYVYIFKCIHERMVLL